MKRTGFVQSVYRYLPPFLAVGYGVYLLWLFFSKKILLFVQQGYVLLTLVSGIFLSVVACIELYHLMVSHRAQEPCEATHEGAGHLFAIFIPLLLALIVVPKPLSSSTALLRSGGLNSDAAYTQPQHKISMFDIDTTNRTIIDWIQLFTQDPEPDRYKGLKVKLDGFVLEDSTLPPNYFMVSRFVISCCAADARPVGIPVRYDPKIMPVHNDDWVEVTGTLDVDEIQQDRQPVVIVDAIKSIPVPDNPYAN